MSTQDSAANNLLGKELQNGWKVVEKLFKPEYATGSFFSVCYKVKRDTEECFLKAFDFVKFFQIGSRPGVSVTDILTQMLNAYKYEKELSELCRQNHVSKIAFVRDSGEIEIGGFPISTVPYLIFDLADGDVRKKLAFSQNLDLVWSLKSLHDIAVGVKQLHYIEISHQDLKPSNILLFKDETKIGDIGRSICLRIDSPYKDYMFSGDTTYAPPEIVYRYFIHEWHLRVFAADSYLLGSLIVFYFCGVSMNALLFNFLPAEVRPGAWRGTFQEVQDYLINAFTESLLFFQQSVSHSFIRDDLKQLVERLCHPIPETRVDSKRLVQSKNPYNLERVISKLDYLHKKALYRLR